MNNEQNLIKKTAKELGLTYKELGEAIGYSEGALKNAVSTNNVSDSMKKAVDMFLEIRRLNQELIAMHNLKKTLKALLDI